MEKDKDNELKREREEYFKSHYNESERYIYRYPYLPATKNWHRHYEPWYNDEADYNTNAPSYYDYLARYSKYLDLISQYINRLMDRDIDIIDSSTIDLTKYGSWLASEDGCGYDFEDIIKLKGDIIFSKERITKEMKYLTKKVFTIPNGSKDKNGLWSPDYEEILDQIDEEIGRINREIKALNDKVDQYYKEYITFKNDIENRLNSLAGEYEKLKDALQKIIDNLFDSGAINSNSLTNFDFNPGIGIANGNINLFGGIPDGDFFIRTNKRKNDNDLAMGV